MEPTKRSSRNRWALLFGVLLALVGGVVWFALWPPDAHDTLTLPEVVEGREPLGVPSRALENSQPRAQRPSTRSQDPPPTSRAAPAPNSAHAFDVPPPVQTQRSAQTPQAEPSASPQRGLGHYTADGGLFPLTRDGIRQAMRERLPEVRNCYESWAAQNPQLEGTLLLNMIVRERDGEGQVVNVDAADGGSMGHWGLEGCVRNVMVDMRFEPPEGDGEMRISYPFSFMAFPSAE